VYRHVVLFRVHDAVSAQRTDALMQRLRGLRALPGILEWRIERSLDTRKGTVIVEDGTFVDRDAYEAFRVHPEHRAVAEAAAELADWWVGDYDL